MNKALAASLTVLALSSIPLVQSANVDAVFYLDQNKLVIPNLKVGGAVYYVILNRLGNVGYDFRLDPVSATVINGALGFTPAAASDLVGSWAASGPSGATVTFTLNANGTYSITMPVDPTDQDCPKGGTESGTYQYEPATGVFTAIATVDNNGQCGFSHPSEVDRIKKVGTDLYIFWHDRDSNQDIQIKLLKTA